MQKHQGNFPPAKFVDHCRNREGPDHAPHTEDGHSKAPHQGVCSWAEGLPVPLQWHIMEKRTQFLSNNSEAGLDVTVMGFVVKTDL